MTEKKQGWQASQGVRSKKARLREMGMFNDLAKFVMDWRLNGGDKLYPPEARLRDFLNQRGWRAERGGEVTIRTVQEMIRFMDPELKALPSAQQARIAESLNEVIPGSEVIYMGFSPKDWLEYRDAVLAGWKPHSLIADASDDDRAGSEPKA